MGVRAHLRLMWFCTQCSHRDDVAYLLLWNYVSTYRWSTSQLLLFNFLTYEYIFNAIFSNEWWWHCEAIQNVNMANTNTFGTDSTCVDAPRMCVFVLFWMRTVMVVDFCVFVFIATRIDKIVKMFEHISMLYALENNNSLNNVHANSIMNWISNQMWTYFQFQLDIAGANKIRFEMYGKI